jgi:hypothetical protein
MSIRSICRRVALTSGHVGIPFAFHKTRQSSCDRHSSIYIPTPLTLSDLSPLSLGTFSIFPPAKTLMACRYVEHEIRECNGTGPKGQRDSSGERY